MKRRLTFSTLLALVLVLGVTVTAMAAGPGPNAVDIATPGTAGQGAALYGEFVDEDGDDACDNYIARTPAENGTGNRWSATQTTPGGNFIDEDGDGVCDICGETVPQFQNNLGQQMRRGRWSQ